MLKRKLYSELLNWKSERLHNHCDKYILITGASQVGKTYLVKQFANAEYESFIDINFRKQPQLKKMFEDSSEDIVKKITANIRDVNFVEGKTLILLDEIQYAKQVVRSLDYMARDMRFDLVVISPTGIDTDENARRLTLYPFDFEEFLWANGFEKKTTDSLHARFEANEPLPLAYHNRLANLFREYIVVGGMPEVVYSFYEHRDFAKVMKLQQNILVKYRAEIAKSNTERRAGLINKCYNSIPKQLNSELKKFKYSRVEKGQTKRKYGTSVDWLLEAGYVIPSYNAINASVPLEESSNKSQFKLYLNDVGLLTCIYGFDTKRHVLNNVVKGNVRTAIYENIVAESLRARGYNIYYHKPDDNHEVEFIIEKDSEAIPIEAKVGSRVSVSMSNYITKFKPGTAYKLTEEIGQQSEDTQIMPYYGVVFALS